MTAQAGRVMDVCLSGTDKHGGATRAIVICSHLAGRLKPVADCSQLPMSRQLLHSAVGFICLCSRRC